MPYLPRWIEQVHEEQLRLEAAGTSRIEGAEFTQREQEEALAPDPPAHTGLTHSQRQLRAADATYRWMRSQPADRWVTTDFILETHRRIVTGCDDDHCEPGALRPQGWNVTFGTPPCRGADGGAECRTAFDSLCSAIAGEFRQHDRIVQAIATHYHVGSMHPFGDGNGRTARALEAFMLRQAGVNDMVMVSLSNYYYEHKEEYLAALFSLPARGTRPDPLPPVRPRGGRRAVQRSGGGHRRQPPAHPVPGIRQVLVRAGPQSPSPGPGGQATESPGGTAGWRGHRPA